jgi:HSP20 family molecular chaperone IbpA
MGIDVEAEMKKLMSGADSEIRSIREKFFNLQPLALMDGGSSDVVKLDSSSINNYVDKAHNDRLKFNFDVTEFESESISVKSDGNKIEVHAKKRSKKGDDEQSEEYSRVYELPTSGSVNPDHVTSSFFKDGILTVELPVSEAIDSK